MKAADIRSTFLKFFESKGHQVVASSPVVPGDDPTLLRTLGRLCAAQGLWGKAEEFLVLASRAAPERETQLLLGQLYDRLGRAGEANERYRLAALADTEALAPLPPAAPIGGEAS